MVRGGCSAFLASGCTQSVAPSGHSPPKSGGWSGSSGFSSCCLAWTARTALLPQESQPRQLRQRQTEFQPRVLPALEHQKRQGPAGGGGEANGDTPGAPAGGGDDTPGAPADGAGDGGGGGDGSGGAGDGGGGGGGGDGGDCAGDGGGGGGDAAGGGDTRIGSPAAGGDAAPPDGGWPTGGAPGAGGEAGGRGGRGSVDKPHWAGYESRATPPVHVTSGRWAASSMCVGSCGARLVPWAGLACSRAGACRSARVARRVRGEALDPCWRRPTLEELVRSGRGAEAGWDGDLALDGAADDGVDDLLGRHLRIGSADLGDDAAHVRARHRGARVGRGGRRRSVGGSGDGGAGGDDVRAAAVVGERRDLVRARGGGDGNGGRRGGG